MSCTKRLLKWLTNVAMGFLLSCGWIMFSLFKSYLLSLIHSQCLQTCHLLHRLRRFYEKRLITYQAVCRPQIATWKSHHQFYIEGWAIYLSITREKKIAKRMILTYMLLRKGVDFFVRSVGQRGDLSPPRGIRLQTSWRLIDDSQLPT